MRQDSALLDRIRNNILFESTDESILEKIAGECEECSFTAGEIIFEDRSEGNSLYLILSGNVIISKCTPSGEVIVLGALDAGDFFGEVDLLDERLRSARATAGSNCTLVKVSGKEFHALLQRSSSFAMNVFRRLSLRLRSSNATYIHQEESNLETLRRQVDHLHTLVEATKLVNSTIDIEKLLEVILRTAVSAVGSDRGTVYLIDEARSELWSRVMQGASTIEIRLPLGNGIAGYVAQTGETINIPDAYADLRFTPEVEDRKSTRLNSSH